MNNRHHLSEDLYFLRHEFEKDLVTFFINSPKKKANDDGQPIKHV
jgi:hypothetical protein